MKRKRSQHFKLISLTFASSCLIHCCVCSVVLIVLSLIYRSLGFLILIALILFAYRRQLQFEIQLIASTRNVVGFTSSCSKVCEGLSLGPLPLSQLDLKVIVSDFNSSAILSLLESYELHTKTLCGSATFPGPNETIQQLKLQPSAYRDKRGGMSLEGFTIATAFINKYKKYRKSTNNFMI